MIFERQAVMCPNVELTHVAMVPLVFYTVQMSHGVVLLKLAKHVVNVKLAIMVSNVKQV
jgi:hypothetical protein